MNRIICDVCGSEYAESADRCPICSYPRQGSEKIAAAAGEAVRTKVKGGRFSSKNVKKRRKAMRKAAVQAEERDPNKPLLIVIAVLLAAIVLVSLFIAVRFFRGRDSYLGAMNTPGTTLAPEFTAPPTVPCTQIVLDAVVLDLREPGEEIQLAVTVQPGNTTDAVTYHSADPAVASVSDGGVVTAFGSGQTTITVTCGGQIQECTVVCRFEEETTAPVQTTAPTQAALAGALELDQSDVSFFNPGESFTLSVTKGGTPVAPAAVTWTTSNARVATVVGGLVTAVGPGNAAITAAYAGEEVECIVRCQFTDGAWKASSTDVTLSVGESFPLTVTNSAGETAEAIWTMDVDGIVSIDGNTITARAPGRVTLTATVDGVSVKCIVRVV